MDKGNDHLETEESAKKKAYVSTPSGADNVKSYGPPDGKAFATEDVCLTEEVAVKVHKSVEKGDIASPLFRRVSPDSPKSHEDCGD